MEIKFRESGVAPGESTGTLHWGDNSATRVRDGQLVRHIFKQAGIYTVALQPDEGEKVAIGKIQINAQRVSEIAAGGSESDKLPACYTITLPSTSATCGDPLGDDRMGYSIDFSGQCPVLVPVNVAYSPTVLVVGKWVYVPDNQTYDVVSVAAYSQATGTLVSQRCSDTPHSPAEEERVATFMDLSGNSWTAVHTVTRDNTSVRIGEVILTPDL